MSAYDDRCAEIAERVGISGPKGNALSAEITSLARQAMVADEIGTRPMYVAREITALLDDMVRNP